MKLFLGVFQFIFGCRHRHLSRVFTIKHRTYKVCFDCGREFDLPAPRHQQGRVPCRPLAWGQRLITQAEIPGHRIRSHQQNSNLVRLVRHGFRRHAMLTG